MLTIVIDIQSCNNCDWFTTRLNS